MCFFPSRFVNLHVHNDPVFRRYSVNESFSAASVCPECPFTVKYSYCRSSITVQFSYVVTYSALVNSINSNDDIYNQFPKPRDTDSKSHQLLLTGQMVSIHCV